MRERERKSKQNKEITQARTKIQELYTNINSENLRDMLNVISEALMHHNVTVAKQVLKTNFDDDELFDNKADAITELYQLACQHTDQTDANAALSIALITE